MRPLGQLELMPGGMTADPVSTCLEPSDNSGEEESRAAAGLPGLPPHALKKIALPTANHEAHDAHRIARPRSNGMAASQRLTSARSSDLELGAIRARIGSRRN